MPIYEFECQACQHQFEERMKISDPLPESCPACSKKALKKLISRTSFTLKGSGWFNTLYHKPAPEKTSKEGASKPSDAKTEPKTDAKTSDKKADKAASKQPEKPKTSKPATKTANKTR